MSNETEDLYAWIQECEEKYPDRVYDATLVSVHMLRQRGKTDEMIERRLGIKLKPEHRYPADLSKLWENT